MFLGKVVGTVVSTQKDPKLRGGKLLVVQHVTMDLQPSKGFAVAMDSVGAGQGELVICAAGSSARMTEVTEGLPVDTVILGIVDSLEIEGKIVFRKEEEA
ncbi:MAG TPA: EutN/CcmL family microcompartment protein [bacterium]|nr:EutN/CcmL family microcompartment protein [bacterium]